MKHSIKSANRVLDVLELLGRSIEPVAMIDIAAALSIPKSSASKLLTCLAETGYVRRSSGDRGFVLTARAACIGHNVQPRLFGENIMSRLIDHVRKETGLSVMIGMMQEDAIIHLLTRGQLPDRLAVDTMHSPALSPLGKALLAHHGNARLDDVMSGIERRWSSADVIIADLKEELRLIHSHGYALCINRKRDGIGILGMRLPTVEGEDRLAIGLVGPAASILSGQDFYARDLARIMSALLPDARQAPSTVIEGFRQAPADWRQIHRCVDAYIGVSADEPIDLSGGQPVLHYHDRDEV